MKLWKIQLRNAVKWACYVGLVFLASILQGTPGLFMLFGVKPVLIVPVCVAVAILEGDYNGAFLGVLGGLLWDLSAGRVAGFFAILTAGCCFGVGYLFKTYFQQNNLTTMMINAGALGVLFMADFLFNYLLFDLQGVGDVFFFQMVPTVVFTAIISPIPFWMVKKIYIKFKQPE